MNTLLDNCVFALAVKSAAFFVSLTVADELFIRRKRKSEKRRKSYHYLFVLLVLCILLAGAGPPAATAGVLVVLFALSLAWHWHFAYFGDALKPESLLIFIKPDHFADAIEAGWSDVRRLAPATLLVLAGASISIAIAWLLPAPIAPGAAFLAGTIAFTLGIAARAALWGDEHVVYPVLAMPSPLGGLHALSLAFAWFLRDGPRRALSGGATITYFQRALDTEPVTVAVLMGESIAPSRLFSDHSISENAPLLRARERQSSATLLLAKQGFSAGLASNSSLAAFLSGAPFPERSAGAQSLFQLAAANGFATYYLSGQTRSPLDLTAGPVDFVATRESIKSQLSERKDWALVDVIEASASCSRAFFFVYPRVNHVPYYNHQTGSAAVYFPKPRDRQELTHNYDIGLRAFDQLADGLLGVLEKRPGALFAFVTSDHNEFLGEGGVFGHNISGSLAGSNVPVMLFTNRPNHPLAARFRASDRPDAFQLSRMVMEGLGFDVAIEPFSPTTFFVNNTLPFGRSGYLRVERSADPVRFNVSHHDRAGRPIRYEEVVLTS